MPERAKDNGLVDLGKYIESIAPEETENCIKCGFPLTEEEIEHGIKICFFCHY